MAVNWRESADFPTENPDITLVFRGLMALCQRSDNGNFEFGCFGAELGHKLSYRIDTETGGVNVAGNSQAILAGNVEFSVENASAKDEPKVFQSVHGDKRDFSYVIDIEQTHGKQLVKKPSNFQHIVTVKNGLLYTIAPTTSVFEMRDETGNQIMPPKRIAFGIGIKIFLDKTQQGVLNVPGQAPILLPKDGSQRIIRISHECETEYNALSPDFKRRNDFYMNYDAVIDREQSGVSENFLMMVARRETPQLNHFAGFAELADLTEEVLGGKNTSPCTAIAFGNTDNW